MASVFAITAAGPGRWSIDAARGRERWGDGWAVAQLAGALAGSALAVEAGRRLAARAAEAEAQAEQQPPQAETTQAANGRAPEREPVAA